MVGQQILEFLFLHLLLVGNRLQHTVIVLWCAKVNEHWCIDRVVLHGLGAALVRLMVRTAHRALFGTSDAGRNDQVQTELTRLNLLPMMVRNSVRRRQRRTIVSSL